MTALKPTCRYFIWQPLWMCVRVGAAEIQLQPHKNTLHFSSSISQMFSFFTLSSAPTSNVSGSVISSARLSPPSSCAYSNFHVRFSCSALTISLDTFLSPALLKCSVSSLSSGLHCLLIRSLCLNAPFVCEGGHDTKKSSSQFVNNFVNNTVFERGRLPTGPVTRPELSCQLITICW